MRGLFLGISSNERSPIVYSLGITFGGAAVAREQSGKHWGLAQGTPFARIWSRVETPVLGWNAQPRALAGAIQSCAVVAGPMRTVGTQTLWAWEGLQGVPSHRAAREGAPITRFGATPLPNRDASMNPQHERSPRRHSVLKRSAARIKPNSNARDPSQAGGPISF